MTSISRISPTLPTDSCTSVHAFRALVVTLTENRDYVSASTAKSLGLAYTNGNNFVIRADNKTKLKNGDGRKSVRIQSKKQWNHHVSVYAAH